ncbi:MAG: hypothetical protein GY817_01150 [bacterium]|nr:hypothetical protein [bacterium]
MAIVEIPTRIDIASYKYEIALDNEIYTFQFTYVDRLQRWVLNILTIDEEPIVMGITLHSNSDLLGRFANASLPQGKLMCYDIEGELKSAGRDDLGVRVKLLYQEAQ